MEALPVVMFVALFIASVAAGEPRCSRFNYDERTLEKMIRTEVKCETVISDVKDFKELVKEDLDKFKAEKARLVQEIQTALVDKAVETKKMTDEIQTSLAAVAVERAKIKHELQTSLAAVVVERAKIKDELQTSFAAVVVERAKIKDEIQTAVGGLCSPALKSTVVSFKAKMTSGGNINHGGTLIFQDVLSNHGNGYDAVKGMFRAPVGGVYLFTLQLCLQHQQYFVLETVIDDIAVSHATMYDYYNNICHDHTDLVTLAANSSITFRSGTSSRSPVYIKVDSTQWNSYIAGVLVIKQ